MLISDLLLIDFFWQLHHVGAPSSLTIAPVTYMWRPSHQQSRDFDVVGHKNDVCHDILKIDNSSASRQVWVWIHAAAFREGYDVLESACQREVRYRYLNPF